MCPHLYTDFRQVFNPLLGGVELCPHLYTVIRGFGGVLLSLSSKMFANYLHLNPLALYLTLFSEIVSGVLKFISLIFYWHDFSKFGLRFLKKVFSLIK